MLDDDEEAQEAFRLLNVLWTKSVGHTGYIKKEWLDLDKLLLSLAGRPYRKDKKK